MLFTFSTENLCIVFRQWRITGPTSLFFSLVAIVLLGAGYEALREFTRRYEASLSISQRDMIPSPNNGGKYNFVYLYLLFYTHTYDRDETNKPTLYVCPFSGTSRLDDKKDSETIDQQLPSDPIQANGDDETSSLLFPARNNDRRIMLVGRKSKIIRGVLYATQVFYSFFIM